MIIRIYSLNDPITSEVRYVGRTSNTLKARLGEHVAKCYSNHNTHKKNWIASLALKGMAPTISLIKELNCSWEESHAIEILTINEYFEKGCKLVNLLDKGSGSYGITSERPMSRKAILQYDLDGNFIREWDGIVTAAKHFNTNPKSIFKAVKGISIKTSNNMWKYKLIDEIPMKIDSFKELKGRNKRRKVIQYSQDGDFIKIHESYRSAAIEVGAKSESNISEAIAKQYLLKGFQWRKHFENYPLTINYYRKNNKKIRVEKKEEILRFYSASKASVYFKVSCMTIISWCNTNKEKFGYKFYFD